MITSGKQNPEPVFGVPLAKIEDTLQAGINGARFGDDTESPAHQKYESNNLGCGNKSPYRPLQQSPEPLRVSRYPLVRTGYQYFAPVDYGTFKFAGGHHPSQRHKHDHDTEYDYQGIWEFFHVSLFYSIITFVTAIWASEVATNV